MDSVKIGGIDYSIERVRDLRDEDGKKLDGRITYNATHIKIDSDTSDQAFVQILWHEILHGIETQAGRCGEVKEPTIDALAFGIIQVMRDNPQLVKLITK
jgi:hypothetical protein